MTVFGPINPGLADDDSWTVVTHDIAPFTYPVNHVKKGYAVEVISLILDNLGESRALARLPFARMLVKLDRPVCTFGFIVARTPERLNRFKWVGPIAINNVWLYARAGQGNHIKTLDDARHGMTIGVHNGNADHTLLTGLGFTNLYVVNDQFSTLKMLIKGRIDLTPIGEMVLSDYVKQQHIDPALIMQTQARLYESELYVATATACPNPLVQQWQTSLDTLKSNGTLDRVLRQYTAVTNPKIYKFAQHLNQ